MNKFKLSAKIREAQDIYESRLEEYEDLREQLGEKLGEADFATPDGIHKHYYGFANSLECGDVSLREGKEFLKLILDNTIEEELLEEMRLEAAD